MENIGFAFGFVGVFFMYIVITKIFMEIANKVGEYLGVWKFFMYMCKKIRKKLIN